MACKLGLPTGVKIVVGGHDQCLNALGAGVVKAGMAVAGLGTYECITPVYTGLAEQDNLQAMGLNIEHYVIPSMYVSFLFNQAGSLIQWFRSVCAGEGSENLDRLQAEMPDDPTDLLVLPYFEPSGSPGYVNDASGVILGLKMQTTRGDILKAIMESTSYYFLELWQHFASSQSEMVVSGGGAKSDRWLQIKADIYGVPVCRPQNTECGTLGAAMLAASVVHALDDLTHAMLERVKHCVRVERTFEPDTQRHNIYRQRAAYYRELFPAWYGKLAQWHQLTRKAYV
jgi:xylulokinase